SPEKIYYPPIQIDGLIVTKLRFLRDGEVPNAHNSRCRGQRCAVAVEVLPRTCGVRTPTRRRRHQGRDADQGRLWISTKVPQPDCGMGRRSDWLCALLWVLFKRERLRYLPGGPLRTGSISPSRDRKSASVSCCSYCAAGRFLWPALGSAGLE